MEWDKPTDVFVGDEWLLDHCGSAARGVGEPPDELLLWARIKTNDMRGMWWTYCCTGDKVEGLF
jgi:hypothetical protein